MESFNHTESRAEPIGSVGSKSELLRKKHMEHGMSANTLAISVAQHKQRQGAKNTHCYHCRWKTQGMNEHGRPYIHCMKTNSPANPMDCGEIIAGCEE